MFDVNSLESVKAAIARGELTHESILANPEISSRYTWDELGLADPVSLKFFGAFASAVASGAAPTRQDVDIPLSTGDVSTVNWFGKVIKVTFYVSDGAPRAVIYFDDKIVGLVSDIEFGDLRKLVYWIDRVLAKSMDVMFEHVTGKSSLRYMPK